MKRWLVVLCVLCSGFFAAQVWAQDESADGDSDTLDQEVSQEDSTIDGSSWWIDPYGYIRVGYDLVGDDPNFDFIGANNGFVLHNARIGLAGGNTDWDLSFKVSLDGAADLRESINTPQGDLDVRLRDAFLRYDPVEYVGLEAGQFKLPFSAEEMGSTGSLVFISRAVGLQGVLVGQGLEQHGIVIGRELGAMLSPEAPIFFGDSDFGLAYYAAVVNGNGANQILNDNISLAVAGRLELYYGDYVRVGGSILLNDRTEGEPPDLFEESDFGFSADLLASWEGLEISGQFTQLTTEYPTVGTVDREQLAYHAQITYVVDQLCVPFAPAYRFAYFHPRSEGGVTAGGIDLDSFELMYHTFGLRVWVPRTPLVVNLNYTLTGEQAPREVENDLFQALIQLVF